LLERLNPTIGKLTQAIDLEVEKCPAARRLKTHPGVGSLTALAFVLIIGKADRFQCGKQIASYLGLVPLEKSSGNQRRLGHITKRRGRKIAKVAMARKLAVRLYWMLRKEWDYEQLRKFGSQGRKSGSHAGEPTASTR
jgi:transposase